MIYEFIIIFCLTQSFFIIEIVARGNLTLFPYKREIRAFLHSYGTLRDFSIWSPLDLSFPPIKLECPYFDTSELAWASKEQPSQLYRTAMLAVR